MNSGNPFIEFFRQNLDFFIGYISLYYPFAEHEAVSYMPFLVKGDAYYPVYMDDVE
jgi:hypothetical protein